MDELVRKTFEPDTAANARLIYVGQKPECVGRSSAACSLKWFCTRWRNPENPLRHAPWSLKAIPTIVKLKDISRALFSSNGVLTRPQSQGKEVGRLVESEVPGGLAAFVSS